MAEEMSKFGIDVTTDRYLTNKVGRTMTIVKAINEVLSCRDTHVILVSPTDLLQMSTHKDILRFVDMLELRPHIDCVGNCRVNFINGSSITVTYPSDIHRGYRTTEVWASDIKDYYNEEELNEVVSNIANIPPSVIEGIYCFESDRATNKFR